jgi:hypothetical protein
LILIHSNIGFWVKYPDCARIVQAYSDQNPCLLILCEYEQAGFLLITYFNKDKPDVISNLCITDAALDKIIKEKFLSLEISLPSTSDLTITNKTPLAQDILKITSEMGSQAILILPEQRRIRMFGLVDLVKVVEAQIENIKKKYESNTIKLGLNPQQVKNRVLKKRNIFFI